MEQLSGVYEKWITLPRWQKWLVITLFALVVFGLYYYLRIEPLKRELTVKRAEVEQLSLTVSRLRTVEKKKKELEKRVAELNKKIEEIESKLPTGKEEVSQIIKSITKADSQMVIKLIKKDRKVEKKYYIAYPYTVELLGTYPNFIRWCEKLSKANRIINFGTIKINSTAPTTSRGSVRLKKEESKKGTVFVKMKVEAFTLKR
ncbi:type 4a pilus biogenesis protein PilO [Thermovibrio sp.]